MNDRAKSFVKEFLTQGTRSRPAVFLDRDGTVSEEVGYMQSLSMYSVFPWTSRAIRRINDIGWAAVLVTNQSGVGRGLFDNGLVEQVHGLLRGEIAREGARLDGIYYCPHLPDDGCECRKPRPGMLQRASQEMKLDLGRSFVIGDRYSDIRTGVAVGARTILVLSGAGTEQHERYRGDEIQPDYVVPTLDHAVELILGVSGWREDL